jgi:hypothetical protein
MAGTLVFKFKKPAGLFVAASIYAQNHLLENVYK